MKSFKNYIKENGQGPANGTGVFTYGLGFQADVIPTNFDVDKYDGFERTKLPWEVENALYAERRRETVAKWLKAAGANAKEAVADQSLPQVPNWQTAKR